MKTFRCARCEYSPFFDAGRERFPLSQRLAAELSHHQATGQRRRAADEDGLPFPFSFPLMKVHLSSCLRKKIRPTFFLLPGSRRAPLPPPRP